MMTTTDGPTSRAGNRLLDDALARWIGLPHLARVLDPQTLSQTLGRPVRLHRLRAKPGHSVIVGWEDPHADDTDRYGWAAVLADPDKVAGVRRRAARAGAGLVVHAPGAGPGRAVLLSGGLASDPGLARELAHVGRRLPTGVPAGILAYNPSRRVVLDVGPVPGAERGAGTGRRVVRVGAGRQDHLVGLARRWHGLGVPTLPVCRLGRRGTAVASPWWGAGDLTVLPEPSAAELAGIALAHLHRVSTGPRRSTRQDPAVPAVTGVIAALLPDLAERLAGLADGIAGAVRPEQPVGLIHGDLSPDQVLWDGDDQIRVVDLDRSRVGSPGSDVGDWLAACTLAGQPELAVAFLTGYRRTGPSLSSQALGAWCGRALLASALEPFRRADPDWRQLVAAQVGLAEDVVTGRAGLP